MLHCGADRTRTTLSPANPFSFCSLLRLVALCDSGLALKGAGQGRSRTGDAMCSTDKALLVGKEAYVSILMWNYHETECAGGFTCGGC
eukprot:1682399-Pyramimonas_sp.AAC.1